MQICKIGLLHFDDHIAHGVLHLGFTVEEKAREWIAANNRVALQYSGLPLYCFLGVLGE